MTLTHTYSVSPAAGWPLSNVDVSNFIHRPILLVLLFQHVIVWSRMSGVKGEAQLNIRASVYLSWTSPPVHTVWRPGSIHENKISQHQRHTPILHSGDNVCLSQACWFRNSRGLYSALQTLWNMLAIHLKGFYRTIIKHTFKTTYSESLIFCDLMCGIHDMWWTLSEP